ncbi:MAG: O-antigen ligase family protein [bacterium]
MDSSHTPAAAGRPAGATLRDLLIVWAVPLLPLLFLGWEISGSGKTVSVPKLLLPAIAGLWLLALRQGAAQRGTAEREGSAQPGGAAQPSALESLNTPVFWGFGAYLAWIAAGTAAGGAGWGYWHLAEEVLYVLILAAVWSHPPGGGKRFWANLDIVCLLLAAWGAYLLLLRPPRTSLLYMFIGTPNVAGAFLTIVILRTLHGRRWGMCALFLAGFAAFHSAGALLGLLFGLIALIRSRRARWPIFAAVLAAAALYVGANVSDPIARGKEAYTESATTSTFWKNSIHPRLYVAQIAATEMARRPWLGSGLGTFPSAFLAAERRETKEADIPWWRFQRPAGSLNEMSAHNDFVRIAVETGIPPALFWLGGCLALLWRLRRHPLARAMMLAFLVQSATDNFYNLANYIPVLWVAIAFAAEAEAPAP